MKKIKSELSLETIISIMTEREARDAMFCKEIVVRALDEENQAAIKALFGKVTTFFIFESDEFRQNLVGHIYQVLRNLSLQKIISIGKDTVLGNVVASYYFIQKNRVIKPDNISGMATLSALKFINDPFMLELIPSGEKLILDLDERVAELNKPEEIEKSARVCELLFSSHLTATNEETIRGMCVLYENSEPPELRFKGGIISSLLKKRFDLFSHSVSRIFGYDIHGEKDLMANYTQIYEHLTRINVPIFFDFEHLRFNDVLYNGNFYFLKFLDNSGTEKLLFPFEQHELDDVQKVYDLDTGTYVTPKGRIGKILLHEIFSFNRVMNIRDVSTNQIEIVKELSEDEIEEKIRNIFKDQNITSHGPAEKADIFTTRLFINNETDLRNAAFILKGKGYPRVYLHSIASNILKAVELPVDIIFLVYIGKILDEALEKFINQCNSHRKMYCIVGPIELTRLLIAYDKLS